MASIDQQFVEYIVKSLVGNPDAVHIDRRIDEKGVLLELTVDPEDLGRVIGKRGATAQSIRSLLRALGTKNDARYNLKIVDNGIGSNRDQGQPMSRDDRNSQPVAAPNDDQTAVDETEKVELEPEPATGPKSEPEVEEPKEEESSASDEPAEDQDESDHSDVVSKTRKELEGLDDLDV